MKLPDTQNEKDKRNKRISKVGIREVIVPIIIKGHKGREINTVADFSIYCSLTEKLKGISMSRLMEIIYKATTTKISTAIIKNILQQINKKLGSEDSYVKMRFNYFIKKNAPISKKEAFFHIPCTLEGRHMNGKTHLYLTTEVFYTSCCPCSKAMCEHGAHNQRSSASVTVEMKKHVSIEKILEIVESNISCEIYPVLKRPDEKYVTEKAYNHPMFVEDVARSLSLAFDCLLDKEINDYVVVINHFESIHQHNAVAIINAGRNLK